jgi:hypothetical protein
MQSGCKEDLVENRQSSSGAPSEQFVESWAVRKRLRRWRHEFKCGVVTIGQHKLKNLAIVKIRYQETSSENIAEE